MSEEVPSEKASSSENRQEISSRFPPESEDPRILARKIINEIDHIAVHIGKGPVEGTEKRLPAAEEMRILDEALAILKKMRNEGW